MKRAYFLLLALVAVLGIMGCNKEKKSDEVFTITVVHATA